MLWCTLARPSSRSRGFSWLLSPACTSSPASSSRSPCQQPASLPAPSLTWATAAPSWVRWVLWGPGIAPDHTVTAAYQVGHMQSLSTPPSASWVRPTPHGPHLLLLHAHNRSRMRLRQVQKKWCPFTRRGASNQRWDRQLWIQRL